MSTILTYQDLEAARTAGTLVNFIKKAINWHKGTTDFKTAASADLYDRQKNEFINGFSRKLITAAGDMVDDPASTFKPITSNFFHQLNDQRNMYSLGNGLFFTKEGVKDKIGRGLDEIMQSAGLLALEHGQSFIYRSGEAFRVFSLLEFVPLIDEETFELRAGIHFWKISDDKPFYATLYEEAGITNFEAKKEGAAFKIKNTEPQAYILNIKKVPKTNKEEVTGSEGYGRLPIVPLYGNENAESTLIGMKQSIDNYDLIKSGFADNVANCQQIYWILSGCGGADEEDIKALRENIIFRKIATVDSQGGENLTPYTVPVPTEAHEAALANLRSGIYEDFGAVDVKGISAAAKTATEINAAYQPMDLVANAFEKQIKKCIAALCRLAGIDDVENVPTFNRDKASNEMEQTQMVLSAGNLLDEETQLRHLPFIAPEEIPEIMARKAREQTERFPTTGKPVVEDKKATEE